MLSFDPDACVFLAGYYDNANDSDDRHVAKGWNYHQGPEWVWPIGAESVRASHSWLTGLLSLTGYFLRAYLFFDTLAGAGSVVCQRSLSSLCPLFSPVAFSQDHQETYHHIHNILAQHRFHIRSDPWAGLPELTNKDGEECFDSCCTQAWSCALPFVSLMLLSLLADSFSCI